MPANPTTRPIIDRHIRRTGEAYAQALAALLPQGIAWPRKAGSVLMRVVRGLAEYWGFVDGRAADLLERESDPNTTIEMLSDWERNWGLPDECFPEGHTIEERRSILLLKMTLMGGQSRAFFTYVSSWFGYKIFIREFSPFMVGISQVGDTRWNGSDQYRWEIGPPEMRFYWTAHPMLARLIWFRAANGRAGVDPHLTIGLGVDLDCQLRRWKPAHTELVFDYTNLRNATSMTGTP